MTLCIDRKGSRTFCGKEECKYHFDKSFASFQGMCCGASDTTQCEENGCNCGKKKVDCWDIEKNGDITSLQITTNSGKKIWLKCNVCNHSFDIHPNNVQNGKWCPYCSMPPRKMCYQEECKRCTEKSFVSCDFHINWSIEGPSDQVVTIVTILRKFRNGTDWDCRDVENLPIFYFEVGFPFPVPKNGLTGSVTLEVEPWYYMTQIDGKCLPAFAISESNEWILGEPFLYKFNILLDVKKRQIGFSNSYLTRFIL